MWCIPQVAHLIRTQTNEGVREGSNYVFSPFGMFGKEAARWPTRIQTNENKTEQFVTLVDLPWMKFWFVEIGKLGTKPTRNKFDWQSARYAMKWNLLKTHDFVATWSGDRGSVSRRSERSRRMNNAAWSSRLHCLPTSLTTKRTPLRFVNNNVQSI